MQHLGHGEFADKSNDICEAELSKPLALPDDPGLFPSDHLEELLQIGLGIGAHLFGREHGAGLRFTAGVADLSGPVADDEDDLMPQFLKLAQLPQPHYMPQVDVRAAWVKALLEAKFSP